MPAKAKASVKKAKDPCAELKRKLKKRDAELKARDAELKEAREQQAATAEILKVISSSPTDIQPVFEAILENARRLCGSTVAAIFRFDGELVHLAGTHNWPPEALSAYTHVFPSPPNPALISGRVILSKSVVRASDLLSDPDYPHALAVSGMWRRLLGVPLLRDGEPIGVINLGWSDPGDTPEHQVELLKTFASQAVIAIENVRLFQELQTRNTELTQSLEQQTATSEILSVISKSPTDVAPVFETILRNAQNLCGSQFASVFRFDGELVHVAGTHNWPPEALSEFLPRFPSPPNPALIAGRVILSKSIVRVSDALSDPDYDHARAVRGGWRRVLGVPLLRGGEPIGSINLSWPDPGETPEYQVELLKTFASQAVIAIENVRLFKELQARNAEVTDALEQQTATSEVLKVISSSPTDTRPVFEAIVKSGVHLFGGMNVTLRLIRSDRVELVASTLPVPGDGDSPVMLDESYLGGRAALHRQTIHTPDVLAEDWAGEPMKRVAIHRGYRAAMATPLLRGDKAIGTIAVVRATPGPFSDKQVALLKTFADQAVIAIENVRLFKELQARNAEITEALEQQTATAEILKVISSSPTDTQPVFEAILDNAMRLCDAPTGALQLYDGERLLRVAQRGRSPEFAKWLAENPDTPPSSSGVRGRLAAEQRPIHIVDRREIRAYREGHPLAVAVVELDGIRTSLSVPMLKEGRLVGSINVNRREVRAFTEKQIELLQTFADQAVIAIENVRLFKELQARNAEITEALEQQTATAEILKVISSSPTDTQPVFEAIIDNALRLCDAPTGVLALYDGERLQPIAQSGRTPEFAKWFAENPNIPASTSGVLGRMVAERRPIHIVDRREIRAYREGHPQAVATVELNGVLTSLSVPLLKEGRLVGSINVGRREVRAFTQKQIDLISTFADQAVIAIENVRLFKELQARNAEITEALEQQTATAEILKVISSSPTDTQPVFEAIIDNAIRLCGGQSGLLTLYDGELLRRAATRGLSPEFTKWVAEHPNPPALASGLRSRMIAEQQPIHILDRREDRSYREGQPLSVATVELGGVRTSLTVPMLKEGRLVGAINVHRREVRAFTQKQIDLISTFASQAVIAIENVRLFNETKEALQQQTVISEILRVISSSPTDTQPVFDAIVKSGVRLFDGLAVSLRLLKGDRLEMVATTLPSGAPREYSLPHDDRSTVSRSVLRREVVQCADIAEEDWVSERVKDVSKRRGIHAVVSAPMLRENSVIGTISVARAAPGSFTDKQIALLKTFADQAVIAIENVRLFKELQARNAEITEALEQQTATAEILKVISSSPTDTQPVFEAIIDNAMRLCDGKVGALLLYDEERLRRGATRGSTPEYLKWVAENPFTPASPSDVRSRLIAERQPIHILDRRESPSYREGNPLAVAQVDLNGLRTYLLVPMLKEGRLVGAISVNRREVRAFTQKQIDLISTFASQAVIAIENVRLFKEIQDKSVQLEIASRHKSEFLASMSHELRTPLNAILGFNEMIIYEMYGAVPPDMKVPLEDIQSSGKHLLRLINNVLDLAKIEAGRMELALEDYSIMDTVTSVRSALHALAAEKGLEFVATVPEDIPLVHGDSGRIMQCLINLAGNSLKFTKAGKVEISMSHHDGLLTCCVSDTGVGIPPDKIGSLFTEFKQTDASIASEYGGTGLGLSITRKFIEMHGGRIWVESEVGQGSRFIFEIPLRAVAQAEMVAHA